MLVERTGKPLGVLFRGADSQFAVVVDVVADHAEEKSRHRDSKHDGSFFRYAVVLKHVQPQVK